MSWIVVDASLRLMRQEANRARVKVPELQVQAQWPRGRFRPYLGVGGGWFVRGGEQQTQGTGSGSIGLRFVGRMIPLGARAELRVRGIGRSFSGSTVEPTFGATIQF